MAKREFIDRSLLDMPSDDNVWEELVKFADDVAYADAITEQDIVKPYLSKLMIEVGNLEINKKKLTEGNRCYGFEPKTPQEIKDEVMKLIDGLLSEQGDTE